MDYITKPTSRKQLREFASILRALFDVPLSGPFPVLDVLEKMPEIFEGSNYTIVEDKMLPPQIMAQCYQNENGSFTIEIKDSVYSAAYEHHVGACLGFICHEICHIFLFHIGFKPILSRDLSNTKWRYHSNLSS